MSHASILFPHQLFVPDEHPALDSGNPVYCVEDQLLFGDWRYQGKLHRQKLMLHRASMQAYADLLRKHGHEVRYIDHRPDKRMGYLFDRLVDDGVDRVTAADPVDFLLEKRLRRFCQERGIGLELTGTPNFLATREQAQERMGDAPRQTSFYMAQRKAYDILLDDKGKPVGGKWTLDTENRRRYEGEPNIPEPPPLAPDEYSRAAEQHVNERYPNSYGAPGPLRYPHTHDQGAAWLDHFVKHRLRYFGTFQDAMAAEEPFLFHSLLSPMLNIGLLHPGQVLDAVLARWEDGRTQVPLNSVEGFVRQVLGWREFMRGVYEREGVRMRTANCFGFSRPMPAAFYDGTTGLDPVDAVIRRVLEHGYCHHIERLMLLGNAMLLCEIDPDAVYLWFMELFVDSYDWVMTPNVYAMSQYAGCGLVTTKPYVSGSNYVRTMSDFPAGGWCDLWDALFWRFVHAHRDTFAGNPRTRPMAWGLGRMKEETLTKHLKRAAPFLKRLYRA